jgi:hypothetical protein
MISTPTMMTRLCAWTQASAAFTYRTVASGAARKSPNGSQTNPTSMMMTTAMASTMRPMLALAVATTCTAAMKLADGTNRSMPTANAAIGLGWVMNLLIRLGFLSFLGFGLRRARKTPAPSATTPRPRRRP